MLTGVGVEFLIWGAEPFFVHIWVFVYIQVVGKATDSRARSSGKNQSESSLR